MRGAAGAVAGRRRGGTRIGCPSAVVLLEAVQGAAERKRARFASFRPRCSACRPLAKQRPAQHDTTGDRILLGLRHRLFWEGKGDWRGGSAFRLLSDSGARSEGAKLGSSEDENGARFRSAARLHRFEQQEGSRPDPLYSSGSPHVWYFTVPFVPFFSRGCGAGCPLSSEAGIPPVSVSTMRGAGKDSLEPRRLFGRWPPMVTSARLYWA